MEQATGHDIDAVVLARTERWIERAVVGLELCPFARRPMRQQRVRMRVSDASDTEQLIRHLLEELQHLDQVAADAVETTLLIHPRLFAAPDEFEAFNDLLEIADRLLAETGLDEDLQIASFHPGYRFADLAPDDPANLTNRSPYPVLHLLRESSLAVAIDAFGDTERIWQRNVERLRSLGHAGWDRLWIRES